MFRLDLHAHFRRCASKFDTHARKMVERAIESGLNGLAFTEHHEFLPQEYVDWLGDRFSPFHVYSGVEVSCGEDVLVYGIHDRVLCKKWDYVELCKFVKERNGALVIAHPFQRRYTLKVPIRENPPDGVELESYNTPKDQVKSIQTLGLPLFSNSDAHKPDRIGLYWNECRRLPVNDRDLAEMIRSGEIKCPESR